MAALCVARYLQSRMTGPVLVARWDERSSSSSPAAILIGAPRSKAHIEVWRRSCTAL